MHSAGCCRAGGDTVFDAANSLCYKYDFSLYRVFVCVWLPGCYEASRTRPLPGLLLSSKSPPTIKSRQRKEIDHECDSSKSSVTFITYHFLHYAVNAEQRVQGREEADREKERKRNGPIPALCYLLGSLGEHREDTVICE